MKFRYNKIKETSKSDHRAVFISELQKVNKKKENIKKFKPWRLNNIILEDEDIWKIFSTIVLKYYWVMVVVYQ